MAAAVEPESRFSVRGSSSERLWQDIRSGRSFEPRWGYGRAGRCQRDGPSWASDVNLTRCGR